MVIFKSKQKKFEGNLRVRLCDKTISHRKCEILGSLNWCKYQLAMPS